MTDLPSLKRPAHVSIPKFHPFVTIFFFPLSSPQVLRNDKYCPCHSANMKGSPNNFIKLLVGCNSTVSATLSKNGDDFNAGNVHIKVSTTGEQRILISSGLNGWLAIFGNIISTLSLMTPGIEAMLCTLIHR